MVGDRAGVAAAEEVVVVEEEARCAWEPQYKLIGSHWYLWCLY